MKAMNSLFKGQARDQRRVELKLDCIDSLVYTRWDPNKEYKKAFVVKNIATNVQTLRWEPPVSPYFKVQFQEPHARLGPMMIAAINIVFRPAKLEDYTSSVEFRTTRGKFTLELKGLLPAVNLGIPPFMDFCYGPVDDCTEKTFVMKNTSDITVTYEWAVKPPFSISPARSSIQKGKSETICCRFQPTKATSFSATALCCTYVGVASEMKMKGIGKYSFLAVATPLLAFGEIVVRTTKILHLVVTNISIVPANFQIVKLENKLCETDAKTFNIIPMNGVIKANTSFTFKVIFNPVTAGNFSIENFEIHTCQTCRASFACSGTAARPVVKLSTFSLDFGSVESGGYISRSVLLDNQSIVPVHFQFMADEIGVFEFLQTRGVCCSNRATKITIQFKPVVIANYYKRIICIIQDQHALYCDLLGNCYRVTLKSPTLMQYHVDQHRELLKTSCSEVQVAIDQERAHFPSKTSIYANFRPYFTASTTSPKEIRKGLNGTEWESHPGAWHNILDAPEWAENKTNLPNHPTSIKAPLEELKKTVTCKEGSNPHQVDQFAPAGADLANTFLNPTLGSSPQGPRHRTSAQQRELAEHLLGKESKEQLGNNEELDLDEDGALTNNQNIDPNKIPYRRKSKLDSRYLVFSKTWQREMEGYKNCYHHEIWDEYFIGRIDFWEPVSVDQQDLDFGLETCSQLSEPQFLHIHNNIQTPVTVLWVSPKQPKIAKVRGIKPKAPNLKTLSLTKQDSQLLNGSKVQNVFHVIPDKAIIPVGGSYTFSVMFEPNAPNNHYCQFLQLFVWTPSVDRVLPPWSTLICAVGHSFQMQSQEFLPEFSVSKSKINFPPVLKGFSVHQTVILRNHNITIPLSFIFQVNSLAPEFIVKPEQGLIPAGEFHLITFRYDASGPQKVTSSILCILNHSATNNLVFILNGSSHLPKLVLEHSAVARFKPTAVGTRTTLYVILRNESAITTEFEWQVPNKLSEAFIIKPISGLLRPRESVTLSICFLPQKPKLYYCRIPCRAFAHVEKVYIKDNGFSIEDVLTREVNRIHLTANGEGVVEAIQIEPKVLDYGVIVVGFPYKALITLKNLSAGSLRYDLSAQISESYVRNNCKITFNRQSGHLRGHAKRKVIIKFHAIKEMPFEFNVICQTYLPLQEMPKYANLLPDSDLELAFMSYDMPISSPCGAIASTSVTVHAKYPYLSIVSVRSVGLSNPQMWRELQVRKLNSILFNGRLLKKPSGEAVYEDLFGVGQSVIPAQEFTFDFGAQLISTDQTIVDFVFKSGNELPMAWRVRLWNDIEVGMANWVVPMEPTDLERKYMLIRKFNLFHVEPRKGYIVPGKEQFVRFRYVHIMEGTHVLPAIIEVQHGRTIYIDLKGRSLPHPPRILVADVEKHFLRPTPVGVLNPAYQTVELCNRGPCDIGYKVDIKPLEEMMKANFGFKILWCQNPSGTIPAQDSILLNWMFQPLEPKHYDVEIPVHISEGEGRLLFLEGNGIQPQRDQKFLDKLMTSNEPLHLGKSYNWPDLPIILSTELMDFDNVLELSDNFRLLAIQCLLEDCKVQFAWHNSAAIENNVQGKLQVYPEQGVIEPGKQVLCKVQFMAGFQPQSFETTMYLVIQRIPIEIGDPLEIPGRKPPLDPVDILVDTWPPRLSTGIYNKQFKHDCVIERFTTTAKLHMTDNARFKLEVLEANRDLERNKQLEKEALTFNPPPPIFSNMYLTIRSQIRPRVYNSTREDFLSTEGITSFKLPERTIVEVQTDLIFGIMLEFIQESLENEICVDSFESLEAIGDRILHFEGFKKPCSPTVPPEDKLEGLPSGTLPEAPPWINFGKASLPQTPCATFANLGKAAAEENLTTEDTEFGERLRHRLIYALTNKSPPSPPQSVDKGPIKKEREEPSLGAIEMAYLFLEESLFEVVKTLFDEDQ